MEDAINAGGGKESSDWFPIFGRLSEILKRDPRVLGWKRSIKVATASEGNRTQARVITKRLKVMVLNS